MPEESTDVLMRIVGRTGVFPGESRTRFAVHAIVDTLRKDFEPGQFCELREFSFSAGVAQSIESSKDDPRKQAAALKALMDKQKAAAKEGPKSGFEKWTAIRDSQNKKLEKRNRAEFVDMQPVEFTRIMDSASTLLFKALVECDTLETISIVKRKAGGNNNTGGCYLRLDFSKVLVTDLSWKDDEQGHVMVETGSFIYRHLTIRYRPQKDTGVLGPVIHSEWTMKAA